MGTKWDHSTAIDDKESWDETIYSWKASNILGWSLSTVLGMYTSAFGVTKQQLMLGWERKINMFNKYEWYYAQPTKVLMNGEGKIDLSNTKKETPNWDLFCLMWRVSTTQEERDVLAKIEKAGNSAENVANKKTETYGSHTLNVAETSTETVAMQKTINSAMALALKGGASVAIQSGGSSIAMSPASIMLTAPTINIG